MSAKVSKTVTKVVTTRKSTSSAETNVHDSSEEYVNLNISREEEKKEISILNDRLASYIEHVRNLELNKENLFKEVTLITESNSNKCSKIRRDYDAKIAQLHNKQVELNTIEMTLAKELDSLEAEKKKKQNQIFDQESRIKNLESKNRDFEDKISAHETFRDQLSQRLKRLEVEILQRKNAAAAGSTSRLSGVRIELEQSSIDTESHLAEEIRRQREVLQVDQEKYILDIKNSFNEASKIFDEMNVNNFHEVIDLRAKIDLYRTNFDCAKQELELLKERVKLAEKNLSSRIEFFNSQLKRESVLEDDLKLQLDQKTKEFDSLIAHKLSLDKELLAYRKMIEGEDSRLSFMSRKKRHYNSIDMDDVDSETSSSSIASSNVKTFSRESVGFHEIDKENGTFIRLQNRGSQPVSIGGWTLEVKIDNSKKISPFKFKKIVLAPSEIITLWNGNEESHSVSSSDIVMSPPIQLKNAKRVDVSLINERGIETAGMVFASKSSSSRQHVTRSAKKGENCSVM